MLPQKIVNGITFKIRHTMLPVSNMERTVDFYTRLLGMDVQRIRDVPERGERVRYLGYGSEDEGPSLELIESVESRDRALLARWSGHVALYVSDCYRLCETLKSAGVEFVSGPGPNRPGSKDIYAFIKDPDGYVIELTERHAKTGPG
ncbi:MAG TPA: VOC family protein [Candidatus Binatia bacterium]|nr:VOC family protein [Candidatus Binatia bacterium]